MSAIAPMKALFDATTANKNIDFATVASVNAYAGTTGDQSKSLTPDGNNLQGVQRWAYKGGGIALGYPVFTMAIRNPTKASRLTKISTKIVLPVLEQTSASTASGIQPAPTLAYSLQCTQDFLVPERSSTTERLAFLSLVLSALLREVRDSAAANAVATASPLIDAVLSDEHPY